MRTLWSQGISIILFTLLVFSSAFALQWPCPSSTVNTGYGWRIHPIHGVPQWHTGIDISTGGASRPLKAVATGTITDVYYNNRGGNQIIAAGWGYSHLPYPGSPVRMGILK